MTYVEVSDEIVSSAVRYALGRATYIVRLTVNEVVRVWPHLSTRVQNVIERDIREAAEIGRLGMECDATEWHRLLDFIQGGQPR